MKEKQTICYVAGKSGGHIIPCLTLAHEHKQHHREDDILFFSTENLLDIEIISTYNEDITWHVPLPLSAMTSKPMMMIKSMVHLFVTCFKSFFYLIKHRPARVVCTGGLLSVPVVICARILAIPVTFYELNVLPGKATRFLSRWSIDIRTCFAQTAQYLPKKKCTQSAYPIRFFGPEAQITQQEALQQIGFDTIRKTILVLGGSQGSLETNNLVKQWIDSHHSLHTCIQIIHQTGRNDSFDWQSWYAELGIPARVFSFSDQIAQYYAAADVVICRSGAGTLFETLFFGKKCITIPLETPESNHQVANALAMHEEYGELFTVVRPKRNDTTRKLSAGIKQTLQLPTLHKTHQSTKQLQ